MMYLVRIYTSSVIPRNIPSQLCIIYLHLSECNATAYKNAMDLDAYVIFLYMNYKKINIELTNIDISTVWMPSSVVWSP